MMMLVFLAVYDLQNWVTEINDAVNGVVLPLFHLGVLVAGVGVFQEFSFGRCGPFRCRSTGSTGDHVLRDYIFMGQVSIPNITSKAELIRAVMEVVESNNFKKGTYQLLTHNCVDFSGKLVRHLTGREIDEKFKVAARAGKAIDTAYRFLQERGFHIDVMSLFIQVPSPASAPSTPSDVVMLEELPADVAQVQVVQQVAHFSTPPPKPTWGTSPPPGHMPQAYSAPAAPVWGRMVFPGATSYSLKMVPPSHTSGQPATPQPASFSFNTPQPSRTPAQSATVQPSHLSFNSPPVASGHMGRSGAGHTGTHSVDRSRSRGLQDLCMKQWLNNSIPEISPMMGQDATSWLNQELSRGRQLGHQGLNRNSDLCNIITVERLAELFFKHEGVIEYRKAQRFLANYRATVAS